MAEQTDWKQVRMELPAAEAPTVSEALISAGATGTWLSDGAGTASLTAYFPPHVDVAARLARVRGAVPGLRELPTAVVEPLPSEAWETAWREQFRPVCVGDRWVVQAPWHERPASARQTIVIEPGMAFGTGLHHTTQMCLAAMSERDLAGRTVLDLGTGSGVLAIAACLAGASQVIATDCDFEALRAARKNVRTNGVSDRIAIVCARGLAGLRVQPDVVVANLNSRAVVQVSPELSEALEPGAAFIASGIAAPKAGGVESRLRECGFRLLRQCQVEDWITLETVLHPRASGDG